MEFDRFAAETGTLRPAQRARRLRRRLRRQHQGRESRTTSSRQGLQILVNLDHRGAVGADPLVGDGAGCLIQIPDALLRDWARRARRRPAAARPLRRRHVLPAAGRAGARLRGQAVRAFHQGREARRCSAGATCRPTPTGPRRGRASSAMPVIRQAIVGRGPNVADQDAFERKLLAIRKQTQNPLADAREEAQAARPAAALHAVASRRRTVVYKGLLLAPPGRQLLQRPARTR